MPHRADLALPSFCIINFLAPLFNDEFYLVIAIFKGLSLPYYYVALRVWLNVRMNAVQPEIVYIYKVDANKTRTVLDRIGNEKVRRRHQSNRRLAENERNYG